MTVQRVAASLLVGAILLAAPAMAQSVPFLMDTGDYDYRTHNSVDGHGHRLIWGLRVNNEASWVGGNRIDQANGANQSPLTFTVTDGDTVHFVTGTQNNPANAMYVSPGSFQIDASGIVPGSYDPKVFTPGWDTDKGLPSMTLTTHPVNFNLNGYNSGWQVGQEILNGGTLAVTKLYLPASVTGVYHITTPGATPTGTFQTASFTVDVDGNVDVFNPGVAGLAVDKATNTLSFTNLRKVSITWDYGDNPTVLADVTHPTNPHLIPWWIGEPGNTNSGGDRAGDFEYTLVPGLYIFGYVNFPGEWNVDPLGTLTGNTAGWDNGINYFTVPEDGAESWVKQVSFQVKDRTTGDISTMTATISYTAPPVPEPATMTLLALGGLAMLRRGRR